MKGRVLAVIAAALGAALVHAESPVVVSFQRDVVPLLAKECAMCHLKEGPAAGLVLEPRFAYAMTVGVPSAQSPLMRIAPGDPERSYLLLKMQNRHREVGGSGNKMPVFPGGVGAGVLSARAEEIDLLRAWIAAGALDN